jgi:hypothetical protein
MTDMVKEVPAGALEQEVSRIPMRRNGGVLRHRACHLHRRRPDHQCLIYPCMPCAGGARRPEKILLSMCSVVNCFSLLRLAGVLICFGTWDWVQNVKHMTVSNLRCKIVEHIYSSWVTRTFNGFKLKTFTTTRPQNLWVDEPFLFAKKKKRWTFFLGRVDEQLNRLSFGAVDERWASASHMGRYCAQQFPDILPLPQGLRAG